MDKQVRWRRRKVARPGEILTAALECFAERGFAATRIEDVAARAGVTKGTVYLYFPSKEELFKAVVRGTAIPKIEQLEAAAPQMAPSDVLAQFVRVWAEEIAPSGIGALPKLVLTEAGNFPDLARFYLDEVVHRGRGLLASLLRRGIKSGEFRPVDVDHVVYCVIAPLLFSMLWKYSLEPHDRQALDVGRLCRAHLDLILHGLKPEGPRPAQH